MNFNPEIFKAYDVRGVYGRDFDEEFALQLGMALVKYLGAKKLVVARDLRPSSPALAASLKDGIKSMGCDIIDIGLATSPLFYFALRDLGADGGVIVTASHNPSEHNGFKIYRHEAMPIGLDSGLIDLKQIIDRPVLEKPKYAGKESSDDAVLKKYLGFVIKKSNLKLGEIRLNIGIDADGPIKKELEMVFEMLAIESVREGADITFKFDSDGDRLIIIDKQGQQMRGDLVVGMLVLSLPNGLALPLSRSEPRPEGGSLWFDRLTIVSLLNRSKGLFNNPKLVHDLRFSRGVLEHLTSRGLKLIRSKVGHTFVKETMRKNKADLGGELSGHVYFKELGYTESAILGMLKIIKVLHETGRSINELVEPMMTWANSGELNFQLPILDFQKTVVELKEKYKDGKIDELDGLTVEYPNWWFILRPSNTESVVRLVVEAKTKNLLDQKVKQLTEIIKA